VRRGGEVGVRAVGAQVVEELADLGQLARTADRDLSTAHIGAFLIAWTQLFGVLTFEITNQTRGMFEHRDDFFEFAARSAGSAIGLR
jgi:hypothetical protein